LRVRAFSLNAQPATRNFQLACFEFLATHLGWVVKAVYYSPLSIRYSLPFYQSLIAIRCHFGSAGASPSQFISLPSRVPRPSSRSKSALSFSVTDYGLKSVAWFISDCAINYRLKPVT
jgi:hypothetical protein